MIIFQLRYFQITPIPNVYISGIEIRSQIMRNVSVTKGSERRREERGAGFESSQSVLLSLSIMDL